MSLIEAFQSEGVQMELEASTKIQALEALVSHAIAGKLLPSGRRQQVVDILAEREERGSTAFGGGIAMPHARVPGLRKGCGVIGRAPDGVEFKSVDGEPVKVFVMLISPENRADEHLATLRWLSGVARDPDFLSFILQAQSIKDVLDVLHERAP